MIEVFVGNSGPPIPHVIQQKLFDEQYSSKGEGRGQGLLFAQDAINKMGGEISLWSKPNEEAEFRFTLPIRPTLDVQEDM
ncbi:MAG: hypothetical protein HC828_16795, partial [Blastochloris sp.]|nr:hypothetical protein [Blastochloris sp.]